MNPTAVILIRMADYYGFEIKESALELYLEVFAQFPVDKIAQAAKIYMLNTENSRFPVPPHKIMDIFKGPQIDNKDLAIELARKLYKAIGDFGHTWEQGYYGEQGFFWTDSKKNEFNSFRDAVVSELGDVAWKIICERGGWNRFVESANLVDEGMFLAQLREHIRASKTNSDLGIDVTKIGMNKTNDGLQAPKDIMKLLTPNSDTP